MNFQVKMGKHISCVCVCMYHLNCLCEPVFVRQCKPLLIDFDTHHILDRRVVQLIRIFNCLHTKMLIALNCLRHKKIRFYFSVKWSFFSLKRKLLTNYAKFGHLQNTSTKTNWLPFCSL